MTIKQPNQQFDEEPLRRGYWSYFYCVILLGSAAIAYSLFRLLRLHFDPQWLILASLTLLTSTYSIKIPAINSKISIGDSLFFTNVLLFGTPAGVITAALDGLAGSIRARTRPRRLQYLFFNVAAMAFSAFIAGTLYSRFSPAGLLSQKFDARISDMLLPLGVLAFAHYLVNSGSIAIIVALEKHKSIFAVWRDGFLWTSITYFAGVAAAAFIAITAGAVTPKVLGVIVPVLLAVYLTYKIYLKRVDEARSLAYYDSLTGLPNRTLFKEKLEEALIWSEPQKRMLAVMFLDLDHFKNINDTYGHATGDLLLKSVASRLTGNIRSNDSERHLVNDNQDIVVGRFGGDEFMILMKGIFRPEDATRIAQRFVHLLSDPYSLNGRELEVAATIGISIYPFDGTNADTLLKNADAALYHAKENGRGGYHLFSQSMNDRSEEKILQDKQLRDALLRKEFEVLYQPKIDARSGKIAGAEAFVRWRHPNKGLMKAAEFIPLAEETGLIKPIGEWVMRTVCSQMAIWQKDGVRPLSVAVNISPIQFRQANLPEMIARMLKEKLLESAHLQLELTESALLENEHEADLTLGEFRKLGVKISIDDFGTGYSSLSRLKSMKLHALKIDGSFVADCYKNPDHQAIIAAIIAIARTMELKVEAEGIETEQQLGFLIGKGIHEFQGIYFSKPLSSIEFSELLKSDRSFLTTTKKESLGSKPQIHDTAIRNNLFPIVQ